MIETWGFFLCGWHDTQSAPAVADYQGIFDRYLDLWVRCEEWGFDGLTWAEHHFNPAVLTPSPHLMVASVAARTTKLRFTTLGSVLALNDARRFAEECGMLSYLTNGRFEPGIAPGAGVAEIVMGGIPAEEARPRYYSGAELLAKAIAGGSLTHQDDFYNLEDITIEPPIHLPPGRSVWVTVMQPDSAAWCAERGYKMCTAWSTTEIAATVAGRYYEAAQAAGVKVDPSMVGLRRRVFVADSDAEAQELYEEAGDLVQAFAGKAFETLDPAILKIFMNPDDFAIGSAETVAERLIEQCRAGGFGVVQAFTDFGGFTHEILARSHELIGTKVAPILRSAEVRPGASDSDVDLDEYKKGRASIAELRLTK
jgi:alkanesulfonate monooxygenase SsuD/methylene tetrahydromethanopterin reductase-like flavin-dependent oxidoreductase (luciferase family)